MTFLVYNNPPKMGYNDHSRMVYNDPHQYRKREAQFLVKMVYNDHYNLVYNDHYKLDYNDHYKMVYNNPDQQYKVVYNYLFSITTIWVYNDPGRDAASKKDCNMADIMYPPWSKQG